MGEPFTQHLYRMGGICLGESLLTFTCRSFNKRLGGWLRFYHENFCPLAGVQKRLESHFNRFKILHFKVELVFTLKRKQHFCITTE